MIIAFLNSLLILQVNTTWGRRAEFPHTVQEIKHSLVGARKCFVLLNYNLIRLYNCIISIIYLVMYGLKWYHFIKPWDISAGLMIRLSDELNIRLALPWGKCEDVSGSVSTNFLHIMFMDKYSSCARVFKQKGCCALEYCSSWWMSSDEVWLLCPRAFYSLSLLSLLWRVLSCLAYQRHRCNYQHSPAVWLCSQRLNS